MRRLCVFSTVLLLLASSAAAAALAVVDVEKDAAVAKTGRWEEVKAGETTYLAAGTPGDALRLEFTGVSVAVVLGEGPKGGRCVVTLDGRPVDGFSPLDTKRRCDRPDDYLVARGLPNGKHVLDIAVAADNPAGAKVFVDAIKHGDFPFGVLSGGVYPPVAVAKSHWPVVGVKVEARRDGKVVSSAISADDAVGWRMVGLEPGRYTLKAAPHPWWTLSQTVDVDVPAGVPAEALAKADGDATVDVRVLNRRLWLPRNTAPAFALKGGAFECLLFASPDARDWSASMTNGLKTFTLKATHAGYDATLGLHRLRVTVPADAPEELYALTVESSEGADTAERAVKVLDAFRNRYTVAHLTDLHVGTDPVINACFEKEIAEINLLRPEFVILTGDSAQFAQDMMMKRFHRLLNGIEVPTFVVAGNHDWYLTGKYRDAVSVRWLGPPNASFDYGDAHVTLWDDGYVHYEDVAKIAVPPKLDDETKAWVKADLEKSRGKTLRIVASHIGRPAWPSLYRDLNDLGVGLYLYGHAHMDFVERRGDTPLLAVQTRSNQVIVKNMAPGYRLVGIDDAKVAFFAYDGEKVNSFTVPQNADLNDHALKLTFDGPNDGTRNGLVATIVNGYDQRFDDARVRFVVAKDVYAARGGRVVERYTSDDGRVSVVLVSVDIPAKAEGVQVQLIALHPQ